jgi:hypothetical protein
MREYRTLDVVSLYCGRVGLSNPQAASRVRDLRPVADGIYEIVSPVQFKRGEVIRLDAPEKIILGRLECLGGPPPAAVVDGIKEKQKGRKKK